MRKNITSSHTKRLVITQDDIDDGIKCLGSICPIATALKRHIKGAQHVSVDAQKIVYSSKPRGKRYYYLTPRPAQQFIMDFDLGENVKPFNFYLPEPAWVQPINPGREKKPRIKTRKHTRKVVLTKTGGKPPVMPARTRQQRVYGICSLRLNKLVKSGKVPAGVK